MLTCTPALDAGAKGEECCITFMTDVSIDWNNTIGFFFCMLACFYLITKSCGVSNIPMPLLIVPWHILNMSTLAKNGNLLHKLTCLALYWIRHQTEEALGIAKEITCTTCFCILIMFLKFWDHTNCCVVPYVPCNIMWCFLILVRNKKHMYI